MMFYGRFWVGCWSEVYDSPLCCLSLCRHVRKVSTTLYETSPVVPCVLSEHSHLDRNDQHMAWLDKHIIHTHNFKSLHISYIHVHDKQVMIDWHTHRHTIYDYRCVVYIYICVCSAIVYQITGPVCGGPAKKRMDVAIFFFSHKSCQIASHPSSTV